MHNLRTQTASFNFNGDFSGELIISDLHGHSVTISLEDIMALVAHRARRLHEQHMASLPDSQFMTMSGSVQVHPSIAATHRTYIATEVMKSMLESGSPSSFSEQRAASCDVESLAERAAMIADVLVRKLNEPRP